MIKVTFKSYIQSLDEAGYENVPTLTDLAFEEKDKELDQRDYAEGRLLMAQIRSGKARVIPFGEVLRSSSEQARDGVYSRALHFIPPTSSGKLDVLLVVDESPSMVIWQERIVAWKALLKEVGAFGKVQTWGFMADSDSNKLQLYLGIGTDADRSQTHEPHELLDPSGQRLILVISDCVSPVWYQKPIIEMLQCWGENAPVAIVQMLPERLWSRTALGDAVRVDLRAQDGGSPNTQLESDSISGRFDKQNDEQTRYDELPMPIITLEARTLKPWAKSLAGCKLWIPGVLFSKSAFDELSSSAQESATDSTLSAAQRFQGFKATSSPTARQLAGYLAAVPLTWPIMRIVQQEMLPDSTPDHLAEVLLSGLIQQKTAYHPTIEADDLRYDFVEGVRDLLLSTTLISETVEVLALVFKKVSKFNDTKTGQAPDFYTLIADPQAVEQLYFEKGDRQVATIAINVLRRLGGKYTKLATKLEKRSSQWRMAEDKAHDVFVLPLLSLPSPNVGRGAGGEGQSLSLRSNL